MTYSLSVSLMLAEGAQSTFLPLPGTVRRGQLTNSLGIIRLNIISTSANGSQRIRLMAFSFDGLGRFELTPANAELDDLISRSANVRMRRQASVTPIGPIAACTHCPRACPRGVCSHGTQRCNHGAARSARIHGCSNR